MTQTRLRFRAVAHIVVMLGSLVSVDAQSHVAAVRMERQGQEASPLLGAYLGGSVVGSWRGTKIENSRGASGYITKNYNFSVSSNGSYRESAYHGGQRAISAIISYPINVEGLAFEAQLCTFLTSEQGRTVKFLPILSGSTISEVLFFSPWMNANQMTLKAADSGDHWGFKSGEEHNSVDLVGDFPRRAASSSEFVGVAAAWTSTVAPQPAFLSQAQPQTGRIIVPSPRATKPLPPNPSPEAIFNYLSNPIEVDFYEQSTPAQRRVILEHAVQRYKRYLNGRGFTYDDFPMEISAEAMFKALADPEDVDIYNQGDLQTRHWMQMRGVVRYVEFRLGIKLTVDQEQRVIREKEQRDPPPSRRR